MKLLSRPSCGLDIVVLFFGLWLILVLGCSTVPAPRNNTASPQSETASVALLSLRPERSSESHVRLYGELRNISSEPLSNVWVVATFRDSSGQLIRSDDFVVQQNPIAPGQTAPFMTISTYSNDIAAYEVSFHTTFGRPLKHIDQRPSVPIKRGETKSKRKSQS